MKGFAREPVYLVLGMHRGGTSALARGLEALGISLGTKLMPPAPGNNERGFWEDADVVALDERVLAALDDNWHSLRLLDERALQSPALAPLVEQARRLLEQRVEVLAPYGFKDPRTARLLVFWQRVIDALGREARYIIATRNPLSVARSLAARDRFAMQKSHLLWLAHMVASLRWTEGHKRVVVDFDRLLAAPAAEMQRIQKALGLGAGRHKEIAAFAEEFLSKELRHAHFDDRALEQDASVPRLALRLHRLLQRLAGDEIATRSPQVEREAGEIWRAMFDLAPAFSLAEDLTREVLEYSKVVANRDEQIAQLARGAEARERQIAEFGTVVANREQHIEQLGAVLGERDRQLVARDGQIAEFAKVVANREARIGQLAADLGERDRKLLARDEQIAEFAKVVANREEHVARLGAELEASRRELDASARALKQTSDRLQAKENQAERLDASLAWERRRVHELRVEGDALGKRLYAALLRTRQIEASSFAKATGPLRRAWHFVETRLLGRNLQFDMRPNKDLRLVGGEYEWRAVGHDPYFELVPLDGAYPSGWVRLRSLLHRRSEEYTLKLYFDSGRGLSEKTAIRLPVTQGGTVNELICLPPGLRQLRWDPMQWTGELTQHPVVMSKAGLVARSIHRLVRVLRAMRRADAQTLEAKGITWRNLVADFQGTYRAASFLRDYVPESGYPGWVKSRDSLTDADRDAIRRHIDHLGAAPRISLIMPVYNTPAPFLRAAIDSVLGQIYERWELCVADDASTQPHVRPILEEYRQRDARIKVAYREVNGHIAAASNSALELASGDYIALLDHDDVLAEHALYHVAAELEQHAQADIVYSDEDKIDEQGKRCDPHFKPDWNPDLLLSQNYVSHLGVYRASLVRQVGGFRQGFEGSQDFDLLLRCLAASSAERVRHIPAILYHWRESAGSTALSEEDKGYSTPAGVRALRDYLVARGRADVEVEPGPFPTTYRLRYPLPPAPPKVSLIIPTRNGCDILRTCIESILEKTTYPNYEILVVDNQSDDERTLAYFREVTATPRVRVLRYDHPFNFSAINNFAVTQVDGEVVALVNNDIEVISPDWLGEMVRHALRPEIGAVGAKLYYSNDTLQHAGVIVGLGGVAGHSHKHYPRGAAGYSRRLSLVQNLSAVTAACLAVRRSTYLDVGGLDEVNLKVAFNDVDFCLRLCERGWLNVWTPYAELYHHESVSRGAEDSPEKVRRFQQEISYMMDRWGERLAKDPYYNPMLTLEREDFQQNFSASPPRPWQRFAAAD